jgi:hypothetical protein
MVYGRWVGIVCNDAFLQGDLLSVVRYWLFFLRYFIHADINLFAIFFFVGIVPFFLCHIGAMYQIEGAVN